MEMVTLHLAPRRQRPSWKKPRDGQDSHDAPVGDAPGGGLESGQTRLFAALPAAAAGLQLGGHQFGWSTLGASRGGIGPKFKQEFGPQNLGCWHTARP